MIKSINLLKFKQFENLTLFCKDTNILVGPNNSGKSTTLDALRILDHVVRFARRHVPTIEEHPNYSTCATYSLAPSLIGVTLDNIVRNYGDEDAIIKISHENGNKLFIHLHPEKVVKAYLATDSAIPRAKTAFYSLFPLDIVVVPTLGPLEEQEAYLTDETVSKNETTRLAHRSFRNIWIRKQNEQFDEFKNLVTAAWPDIVLKKPRVVRHPQPHLEMIYEETRIPREVFWSGFGFQIWLQMITHIMRGTSNSILVLDEPDIYLHPDLQRKLIKLVKARFGQIFLATHSTEIINEANSGDILLISKQQRNARRISTEEGYREIFSYLGSSENAEFARIARARRVIFFEGQDRKIFKKFISKISSTSILDDTDTVYLQSGGFEQWRRISEVNWTLENMFGMNVKIAAIFDRDYRSQEEISNFLTQVASPNVRYHVLSQKEIENYALNKDALTRVIKKKASAREIHLEDADISLLLNEVLEGLRSQVQSQIIAKRLDFYQRQHSNLDASTILHQEIQEFERKWMNENTKLGLIPGKAFISTLSAKLQEACGASITTFNIIDEMRPHEIANDLNEMVQDLNRFFDTPA